MSEVRRRIGQRVALAVETIDRHGAGWLGRQDVVEREAELLCEPADLVVIRVDELAPVLGDLPILEGASCRETPSAEARVALEHDRVEAGLLQSIGCGEACQTGADDGDPCGRGLPRGRPETHRRGGAEAQCAFEHRTSIWLLLPRCVPVRRSHGRCGGAQQRHGRGSRHGQLRQAGLILELYLHGLRRLMQARAFMVWLWPGLA